MLKGLFRYTLTIVGSLAIVITVVSAWTAPAQTPPNDNVAAPLNIGIVDQVKNAGLGLAGNLIVGGVVKVGTQNITCNVTRGGMLRWNTVLKCVEFCDETSWKCTNQAAVQPSCSLPWSGSVVSGSSVTAYNQPSVPYGSSCVSETRTCTSGTLSGSYANQSCVVAGPASCALPWGGAVASGGSVTAYNQPSVPFGSSCAPQTRTCTNGTLSGSYANQSCVVVGPATLWKPNQSGLEGYWQPMSGLYAYPMPPVGGGPNCQSHTVFGLPTDAYTVYSYVRYYNHGWYEWPVQTGMKSAGATSFTSPVVCVYQGGVIRYYLVRM